MVFSHDPICRRVYWTTQGSTGRKGVRTLQRNWIGRSEGANVVFQTETDNAIEVFTTRPDTLWGATFMVLAPEHPLVPTLTTEDQREVVETYVAEASRQTTIQRETADRDKTGVSHRILCRQPGQRRAHSDLDRRLCIDHLWHRGDHGRAGP